MKKFLIIGNMNAITYKEIFPYIKNNELWLGVSTFNQGMYFIVNDDFEYAKSYKFDKERGGHKVSRVSSICWFTNLDHNKRHEEIDLYKKYNEEEYPKYDNYDAIEVSKTCDIPLDYEGVMGVPVTFLDKYCPTQFKVVGCADASVTPNGWKGMSKEFVELYYAQGNTGQYQEGNRLACFLTNDGKAKVPYKRILIKRVSK